MLSRVHGGGHQTRERLWRKPHQLLRPRPHAVALPKRHAVDPGPQGEGAQRRSRTDRSGADPDAYNVVKRTGLLWAVREGVRDVVDACLDAGGNPDLADSHDEAPLLWAAQAGDGVMVERLVASGATVIGVLGAASPLASAPACTDITHWRSGCADVAQRLHQPARKHKLALRDCVTLRLMPPRRAPTVGRAIGTDESKVSADGLIAQLGHSIESRDLRTAMKTLRLEMRPKAETDVEGYKYEAISTNAKQDVALTFDGYHRFLREYGEPLSISNRTIDELVLVMIELSTSIHTS